MTIIKAIELMQKAHMNQKRKEGLPYITHPLAVFTILIENGHMEKDILISALLHDVIEDSDIDHNYIEKEFGKKIADIVTDLTKKDGKFDLKTRESFIIKMADRIHNLTTCPNWKLDEYIQKTEGLIETHRDDFKKHDSELFLKLKGVFDEKNRELVK